jgi:Flp pilus assembly protein TadD
MSGGAPEGRATREELGEAGYAFFCQGRLGEAAVLFASLAGRDPLDPYPHQALGAVYLAAGRALEAILAYTQAIALAPGDPRLYARRGEAFVRLGETQAALCDWAEALRLGGAATEPLVRFVRAALAAHASRE